MKRILLACLCILFSAVVSAQQSCAATSYQEHLLQQNKFAFSDNITPLQNIIEEQLKEPEIQYIGSKPQVVIPVVFHVLYHESQENIPDSRLHSQIEVLNEAFRRLSADTVNTPERFRALAADCEIEFQLAISDPRRRGTTGINRIYTPIKIWDIDDKMKYASEMGADAWRSDHFLNIWVVNLRRSLGYASFPGGDPALDGIVLNHSIVGKNGSSQYGLGKVAVHEAGHWMGLKHIWGDDYCGDDGIADTPTQANFTNGCPTDIRRSCGNSSAGDMYMNYMDITTDACTNLFTHGQKNKMLSLFKNSGARAAMVYSTGLHRPLIEEAPIEQPAPRWLHAQIYPNPVRSNLIIDLAYDPRWKGHTISVVNMQGVRVMLLSVTSTIITADVSQLPVGVYFLHAIRADGERLQQKIIVQ